MHSERSLKLPPKLAMRWQSNPDPWASCTSAPAEPYHGRTFARKLFRRDLGEIPFRARICARLRARPSEREKHWACISAKFDVLDAANTDLAALFEGREKIEHCDIAGVLQSRSDLFEYRPDFHSGSSSSRGGTV
jgi:hypothetical protein